MRIAVTYENGSVFQHFGHTEQFKIYDVEDGKIISSEVVDTNGSGHGALAGVLSALKVDAPRAVRHRRVASTSWLMATPRTVLIPFDRTAAIASRWAWDLLGGGVTVPESFFGVI